MNIKKTTNTPHALATTTRWITLKSTEHPTDIIYKDWRYPSVDSEKPHLKMPWGSCGIGWVAHTFVFLCPNFRKVRTCRTIFLCKGLQLQNRSVSSIVSSHTFTCPFKKKVERFGRMVKKIPSESPRASNCWCDRLSLLCSLLKH